MTDRVRSLFGHLRQDATAGAVLGVESVPDGLATGLLAGVNPLAGVYGYMVGTVAGALTTSSTFMAVQGTGAMAIIVADVTVVHDAADPSRALVTLSILTGIVMIVAGVLRLGGVLRFVSNAVLVGFINAVGVNIILGQLANVTGYSSDAGSRVTRALDTLLHPGRLDGASVVSRDRHDRADLGARADSARLTRARRGGRRDLRVGERSGLARRHRAGSRSAARILAWSHAP